MKELHESKRKCIDLDDEDTSNNVVQHLSKKMKYNHDQKKKQKNEGKFNKKKTR